MAPSEPHGSSSRGSAALRSATQDLRPYCLGFGLFWSAPLLMLSGAGGINAPSFDWLLFVWVQQAALVAAIPACARLLPRLTARLRGALPCAAGALLSAAGVLYLGCFVLGFSSPTLSVATGTVLGVASALFFLAWQTIYAHEGQARTAIYLPCSAVVTVAVCLVLLPCPPLVVGLALATALPFAATYALWRSARDLVSFAPRPARDFAPVVRRDIWQPVACAAAICFAWSLSGHIPALYDSALVLAMFAGLGLASLAVLLIGVLAPDRVGLFEVFRVLFPLVGIVLVAPVVFGARWTSLTVGVLTFGARLMTLLSFMLSAVYASKTQFSPTWVYLRCAYPVLLASFLGDTAGFALVNLGFGPDLGLGGAYVDLRIPALCLMACFAGLMVTQRGGRARSLAEPADDTLLINPPADAGEKTLRGADRTDGANGADGIDGAAEKTAQAGAVGRPDANGLPPGLAQRYGLTAREAEIVALLLKGNTIAALSNKLHISENTTRGHMKRIYRKLDIHSRQELVELAVEPPAARTIC